MRQDLVILLAGALLDLFDTRRGVSNPVAHPQDLLLRGYSRRGCRRFRFFGAGDHFSADLEWLRSLDREPPVISETQERVIHCLGLDRADSTAPHRVVKHP